MDSILNSIKKLLGIDPSCTAFDNDIIMHINSTLMILNQIGIGPAECFRIEDKSDSWTDFISDNTELEAVKTYIHLKVKLMFDPPTSSIVLESMSKMISELEVRLQIQADLSSAQ